MRLLENDDLVKGDEIPITVPQLANKIAWINTNAFAHSLADPLTPRFSFHTIAGPMR